MQSVDLGSVALHSLHSLLAQSFRLIIHLEILADGSTCIRKVTEVIATGSEAIVLQDIFIFHETGTNQHGQILGASIGVGIIPSLVESLGQKGISIDCAQFSSMDHRDLNE